VARWADVGLFSAGFSQNGVNKDEQSQKDERNGPL